MNAADHVTGTTGVDLVMYLTDDLARARTFYETLFGLRPGSFDTPNFVEYDLPDGTTFALAQMPEGGRTPSGGIMFGVSDAAAAVARVESLGGKLLARYGGKICTTGYCLDTEGNPFGLHQRLP